MQVKAHLLLQEKASSEVQKEQSGEMLLKKTRLISGIFSLLFTHPRYNGIYFVYQYLFFRSRKISPLFFTLKIISQYVLKVNWIAIIYTEYVRRRRTSVFTKNTDFTVSNLVYLSIDFNAKKEYNSYYERKRNQR